MGSKVYDLSIIIPAFNEAQSIAAVLKELAAVRQAMAVATEVIVVDDGSSDATAAVVRASFGPSDPALRLLVCPENKGSCAAIMAGVSAARGAKVIYLPADGQFDPRELPAFLAAAAGAGIVIGNRDSRADYSHYRLLNSYLYLGLGRLLFGHNYPDVNWVHLWDRSLLLELSPQSRSVFLLLEILLLAQKKGVAVAVVPSLYRLRQAGQARGGSLPVVLATLRDMLLFAVGLLPRRVDQVAKSDL